MNIITTKLFELRLKLYRQFVHKKESLSLREINYSCESYGFEYRYKPQCSDKYKANRS